MIIDLLLVERFGKWGAVQVEMWNEFLSLFVPQVVADPLRELVANLSPEGLFLMIVLQVEVTVYGNYEKGIIINVDA